MDDVWAARDVVLGRDVAIKAQQLAADGDHHARVERFNERLRVLPGSSTPTW